MEPTESWRNPNSRRENYNCSEIIKKALLHLRSDITWYFSIKFSWKYLVEFNLESTPIWSWKYPGLKCPKLKLQMPWINSIRVVPSFKLNLLLYQAKSEICWKNLNMYHKARFNLLCHLETKRYSPYCNFKWYLVKFHIFKEKINSFPWLIISYC